MKNKIIFSVFFGIILCRFCGTEEALSPQIEERFGEVIMNSFIKIIQL